MVEERACGAVATTSDSRVLLRFVEGFWDKDEAQGKGKATMVDGSVVTGTLSTRMHMMENPQVADIEAALDDLVGYAAEQGCSGRAPAASSSSPTLPLSPSPYPRPHHHPCPTCHLMEGSSKPALRHNHRRPCQRPQQIRPRPTCLQISLTATTPRTHRLGSITASLKPTNRPETKATPRPEAAQHRKLAVAMEAST